MPAIYSCNAAPQSFEPRSSVVHQAPKRSLDSTRAVSVGAGAKIRQELEEDSLALSDWKEEPSAVMRLYFVFQKQFERIVEPAGSWISTATIRVT